MYTRNKVYLKSQGIPLTAKLFWNRSEDWCPPLNTVLQVWPSASPKNWHLKWVTISESQQQCLTSSNNLTGSSRSSPCCRPIGMCLNLSDRADEPDSSDREGPLWSRCHPVTLFGPLSRVTVCDAMVTATVRGGAGDLCLTNGSFITPVLLAWTLRLLLFILN